jgi:histidinol-phosphate/aromatic aminotransferase/cobyric acid decarboxylase-like protein/imidazoleglycerol phosphate dehydratase HisB
VNTVSPAAGIGAAARALPLSEGFTPYVWAPTSAAIAERNGLRVEQIVRFDQNTPPFAGVPQIPLAESFARLNDYPDGSYRALREAAAGYVGGGVEWQQVVVGAGADDLILLCARTFLAAGRRAAIREPTYVVYRECTQLVGAHVVAETAGADLIWVCNPNNPTGEVVTADALVALANEQPDVPVVVDEAYVEYGGDSVVPRIAEAPNLIALRTMSKAFGFASLRVGFAIAAPELAPLLEERREPAPVSGPAALIAAAALREPCHDVEAVVAERERVREALLAAGYDAPAVAGNFVYIRSEDDLAARLERQGLVLRRVPGGARVTLRTPSDDDLVLAALGAAVPPRPGRTATVVRTTTETALRVTLDLDGSGRARIRTGVGFLDHLLTLLTFHAGFDLELIAGGDVDVDEHHTVEDVLAALGDALSVALGARAGVTRYGAATVPMDEARAAAAVDLVRRPHAEIELGFRGERVGGLALTLLPHALERFAMQAGCTVHVESAGTDDHHVAEAAFKALGRALAEACVVTGTGIRSTKGEA